MLDEALHGYNVKNNFLMMLTWCFVGFSSRLLKIFYADSDILLWGLVAQANVKLSTEWELISTWLPSDLIGIPRQSSMCYGTESDQLIHRKIYRFIPFMPISNGAKIENLRLQAKHKMLNIMLS